MFSGFLYTCAGHPLPKPNLLAQVDLLPSIQISAASLVLHLAMCASEPKMESMLHPQNTYTLALILPVYPELHCLNQRFLYLT